MFYSSQLSNRNYFYLLIAVFVTLVMGAVSWFLGGTPGTNGIDDAAITRSYSENIANGHGFVYNIGGEHVEGATSFLWTMVLVIPYLFDDNPEIIILSITAVFTVMSVFLGLRIAKRAAANLHPLATVGLMALSLAGLPAFFIWSVWSMMEVALWSAFCMLTLERLSFLTEEPERPATFDIWLFLAAIAMPLIRPEGGAIIIGLGVLAVIVRPAIWRPVSIALVAAVISFGGIILGRLAYFGFPFPNTYYAKVSADRLQNIVDGAKYLTSFVNGLPFADLLLLGWIALGVLSLIGLLTAPTPGQRTQILASATVLGVFAVYVMLGGDHFALWRFYQPIMPIFALPLVLFAVWVGEMTYRRGYDRALLAMVSLTCGYWVIIHAIAYYQDRFRISWEFELSHRGQVFGQYLNAFEPQPTMGVTAAGGVALTYDGELRDLMGLNWVEMAHANPIKVGFRNHASFDVATFWKHQPDILPLFHKPVCQRNGWTERTSINETGVKQLFSQPQFQATYAPVIMEMAGGNCTNAFAANSWLEQIDSDLITIKAWDELTLITTAADS